MEQEEISKLFDDMMHGILEAHNAFMERAMELAPGDVSKFVFVVDETEKRMGKLSADLTARTKMALCVALRDLLAAHDKAARASIDFFTIVREYKARRN